MKERIVLLLLLVALGLPLAAQNPSGLVYAAPTADGEGIQLKWLTAEIATRAGYNLYRRPANGTNWERLNEVPLAIGAVPMDPTKLAADSNLQIAHQIALRMEPAELPGLSKLNFVVAAVTDLDFARFLGIHYEDRALAPADRFDYEVRAIKGGRESLVARATDVSANDDPAFGTAPSLSGGYQKEGKQIAFDWAHDKDLFFAYHLDRLDPRSGQRLRLNPYPIMVLDTDGESPEYLDPTPGDAQAYTYELSGIDYLGRVSPKVASVEVELPDLLPPDAPTEPASDNSQDGVIALSWAPSIATDVKAYRIYRTKTVEEPARRIKEVPASVTQLIDDQLPGYGYYYYEITAVDAAGNESPVPLYHIANASDLYPPAPPSGVSITAESGKITIDWAKNREGDLAGYVIMRSMDVKGTGTWGALHVEPFPENLFEDVLPPTRRNEMIYAVVAMDTSGNRSELSAIVRSTMPDEVPPPAPFLRSVRTSADSVFLRWEPIVEGDLKEYELQRKTEENFVTIFRPSKQATSYVDAGLAKGLRAEYRLSAVDSAGNVSAPSAPLSVKVVGKGSGPITFALDGKYRKRDEAVRLEWPKIAGESYVFRRAGGAGRFLPISETVTDNAYVDKPKKNGRYDYLVKTYFPDGTRADSGVLTIVIK